MTVRILQFRQGTRNYHFPVRHFSVLTLFCQILRYHLTPCKGFLTIVPDRGDGRGHDFLKNSRAHACPPIPGFNKLVVLWHINRGPLPEHFE